MIAVEQETPTPLWSLYQKGLMSTKELLVSTTSLRLFLRTYNIRIRTKDYGAICQHFQGSGGVFGKPGAKAEYDRTTIRHMNTFRVDPDIMTPHLQEIRNLAGELQKQTHPERTHEEILYFRNRVLRVETSTDGNFQPISLDEAYQRTLDYAKRSFRNRGFADEYDYLASDVLWKMQPYLLGEWGEFESFDQFRKGVLWKTIRNRTVDEYHKSKPTTIQFDDSYHQNPERPALTKSDNSTDGVAAKIIQQLLDNLDPDDRKLLELRGLKGLNYQLIALELGMLPDRKVRGALRIRYYRLLDKLNPQRPRAEYKQRKIKPGITDNDLIAAYVSLRLKTLTQKGRLPTSTDIDLAHSAGTFPRTHTSMARRFDMDGGSWQTARVRLEELINAT